MSNNNLQKRCERCERLFLIPKIRKTSKAFELVIKYTPCPHCLYQPDITNPKYNKSGRCLDCSIPFTMVDHKAGGRCHRCLMAYYRSKDSTK